MIWREPVVLVWPFVVGWRCLAEACAAACEEFRENCSGPGELLLRRGFALMWHAKYHTDRDAAIDDVKRRVR